MANSAFVVYKVRGERKDIDKLENIIKDLAGSQKPIVENGYGVLWLGCVVTALGGNWKDVYCRGTVYDFSRSGDVLTLDIEAAWDEPSEFRHFLESVLDIGIYYYVEESGMCIYRTNDWGGIYFPERYYVEGGEDGSEYFVTLEGVAKHIEGIVGKPVASNMDAINKAIEQYNIEVGEDSDDCLSVYEIELAD